MAPEGSAVGYHGPAVNIGLLYDEWLMKGLKSREDEESR